MLCGSSQRDNLGAQIVDLFPMEDAIADIDLHYPLDFHVPTRRKVDPERVALVVDRGVLLGAKAYSVHPHPGRAKLKPNPGFVHKPNQEVSKGSHSIVLPFFGRTTPAAFAPATVRTSRATGIVARSNSSFPKFL